MFSEPIIMGFILEMNSRKRRDGETQFKLSRLCVSAVKMYWLLIFPRPFKLVMVLPKQHIKRCKRSVNPREILCKVHFLRSF